MNEEKNNETIDTGKPEALATSPRKKGWARLVAATGYSVAGLRAAIQGEEAIRMEVTAFLILAPVGLWLGDSALERVLLVGSLALVFIVELINTCIEKVVDRWGEEYHDLSREAKDIGSAAVFISIGLVLFTWTMLLL